MATYSKLPSGQWRAQVRRGDIYQSHTFKLKRDAQTWATEIETQANQIQSGGYITPKGLTVGKLITLYRDAVKEGGRTRQACLTRLEKALARTKLSTLPFALRTFIDKRQADGAGGVTIAQDLSYLATVLDWGRHTRRLDADVIARIRHCVNTGLVLGSEAFRNQVASMHK
jgi:hypothetical protein